MRILIVRLGAIGDSIVIVPLLRFLKNKGHEIYLSTSETGLQVLAHNPYIDKFIPYKTKQVPDNKLHAYWDGLMKEFSCDKFINMCESIERAISFHPVDPPYNYTKEERHKLGIKNFYEYAFVHSNIEIPFEEGTNGFFRPELFFTEKKE